MEIGNYPHKGYPSHRLLWNPRCTTETAADPTRARGQRLGELPATVIHAALRASPEAKAGMFPLHFGQIHWVAVFRTVLMGRSRALLIYGFALYVQKIAVRDVVMDKTITSVACVDPRWICCKLANRHLGMVFVAERMNSARQCCARHEITSST